MPRSYWDFKNPYCRRSKLSKDAFERVAYFYFLEITSGWSRRTCSDMLQVGMDNDKVSRQTISIYFDLIGQFIWDEMIIPTDPHYADKAVLEDLRDCVHGKRDSVPFLYNVVPDFLKAIPLDPGPETTPFHKTLVFHLLYRRSKVTRGFTPEQFRMEVARAFFVCACAEAKGMDTMSNEGILQYRSAKGDSAAGLERPSRYPDQASA